MTSNFWNRLYIDLFVMDKYEDPELVRHHYDVMLLVLRYFLDHTRGQPFSFQFGTRHLRLVEVEWSARLFESLVAESIRWREINIRIFDSLMPILYKAKHHMPLLSSVKLEQVTWCADMKCIHDLFEDVPRLTCLELAPFSNWRINWASLSVLKLTPGCRSSDELLSVLGQAKRLEKLAIYHWRGTIFYPDRSLISLPNLKVLSTSRFELLPLLQTPSLEELYILHQLNDPISEIRVISYFTRSSFQLRCLGVFSCCADTLAAVLQFTPDLLHLILDDNMDLLINLHSVTIRHH